VKEGRRPLDLKLALGDIGGLKTPLVPPRPLTVPDEDILCDVMSDVYTVLATGRVGVYEVIEPCVARFDLIEICGGDVLNGVDV
jgi:hypothetical protein